jgi:hypothetical protein
MTLKYKKEPYGEHEYAIELINHEFSGIKFVLGKVQLNEDNLTLKYQYDIIESNADFDKMKFENTIGDLLMEMLGEGINKNDLVYFGGIDAN